ncbi:MAG: bifunctional metallophosphatase/5'-nucleotidase [Actinobacteria bacterium]|nr:bifunctional metallophosphatase/5'-nucleotidase [Actinomycetota bacterium]
MRRLTILHTNDIHGREEGIARVATLVEQIRAESTHPVVYLDAGDVEEPSRRLSNLTKGSAMHRLLTVADCAAHAAGNATWMKYGPQEFPAYREVAGYPLLLANFRTPAGDVVPGVQDSALLDVGGIAVGVTGLCEPMMFEEFDFGLRANDELTVIRAQAAELRESGAEIVILLSHLGLATDRELAPSLEGVVDLIVGAHSHDLLPEGERPGGVPLAHAGEYAKHLGRIEVSLGDVVRVESISVAPVPDDIPPHPEVVAEIAVIELEIAEALAEVIGELAEPLELASDRECRIASWLADILRERMDAEVGLVCAGAAFVDSLGAGPLTRSALWHACSSPGNPGVTTMNGEQLLAVVRRGLDPEFAASTTRTLRGATRGYLHLSGAEVRNGELVVAGEPVEPERSYRVAGGDFELAHYGGYVNRVWGLEESYDFPTILRDAIEEHLLEQPRVEPPAPRVYGALD